MLGWFSDFILLSIANQALAWRAGDTAELILNWFF